MGLSIMYFHGSQVEISICPWGLFYISKQCRPRSSQLATCSGGSSVQRFKDQPCRVNLKNIFVSPYTTLFYQYGSVGRIFFLISQFGYPWNSIVYSKTCLKRPLNKRFFSRNACQKYCSHGAFWNTFDLHLTFRFYCIVLL